MKFKKGELVCLSVSGKKIKDNRGYETGFGMVIDFVKSQNWPYKLRWFGYNPQGSRFIRMKEYEIKRFKVKE